MPEKNKKLEFILADVPIFICNLGNTKTQYQTRSNTFEIFPIRDIFKIENTVFELHFLGIYNIKKSTIQVFNKNHDFSKKRTI